LQVIIFGFGRNCSPIEEYVILWFYIFIRTNSLSASNRSGRISKSELYHTSQQLSKHDCPIRIFFHKHKCMYWNKFYASFYLKDVMNMSLLELFEQSVIYKIVWRYNCFIEFKSSDQDYVCLKLKIVGREDAQTKFGTVDLLCFICGVGFECLCGSSLPHLFLYLFIQTKRNKGENK
jgi:hypothetical protein